VNGVTRIPAKTEHRREREGVALCALSAAGFAATILLVKLAYGAGATVVSLLTPRFLIAAGVLWLIAGRRGVAGVARRDALLGFGLGFVLYSSETGLLLGSLTRIEPSLAELLFFCYPAVVVLGTLALGRERPSRRRLAALALASGGVALVLAGGGAGSAPGALGIAMPIGSATIYALYVLAAETLSRRVHPLAFSALLCSGAGTAFATVGVATGRLHLDMPAAAWGWTLGIALGTTLVSISAFLAGVARIGSSRASILAMLEPPLAITGAFFVFGDRLGPLQVAGGLLVLGAAVLVQLRAGRRRGRGRGGPGGYDPPSRQRRATRSNRSKARSRAPGSARAASRRTRASSIP
jgi:drug/metabolite transporter (DMT)-like permease